MATEGTSGAADSIGFIGLGLLGQAMALRLAAQGCALIVWNREPECSDALAAAGATVAASPREVAQRCRMVCLYVLDANAVHAVMFVRTASQVPRRASASSSIFPPSTLMQRGLLPRRRPQPASRGSMPPSPAVLPRPRTAR